MHRVAIGLAAERDTAGCFTAEPILGTRIMIYAKHISTLLTLVGVCSGCASSQGTKPHDMSTTQHETAAAQESSASNLHSAQYAPDATAQVEPCDVGSEALRGGACWSSTINPTEQLRADAQKHERLARQHRAAAQALRDVENTVCSGLSENDRVTSPFFHREDISSVSQAEVSVSDGLESHQQFAGGRAVFRAVPGMTAEWLQRLVNCHLARAASVGFDMPEMSYCPLVLKSTSATASSAGDGFAIAVTSEDPSTAAEIWRRMQALK